LKGGGDFGGEIVGRKEDQTGGSTALRKKLEKDPAVNLRLRRGEEGLLEISSYGKIRCLRHRDDVLREGLFGQKGTALT